jgi:hypothetical protein
MQALTTVLRKRQLHIQGGETKGRSETVYLRIRNKSHLINQILPIFEKYPMFSNKQYDYFRFRDALLAELIKFYEDLPGAAYNRPAIPLNCVKSILSATYFSARLVGFIEAEGCFSVYKSINNYWNASFEISQTNGELLIKAVREYLSLAPTVTVDKTNSYRIKVTGVRSVENIIKFLQKAPVKLLDHKKLQYLLWMKQLRTLERYAKKINIPVKY